MKTLKVALKNCHGIRELDATFSFENGNGVMGTTPSSV